MSIETNRLILRPWAERDKSPFAEMSQDDTVMQFLLPLASRELSDAWIERQIAHDAKHGFCFWAVEESSTGAFVGAVGLIQVSYEAHFTPAVEVGWRIARPFWGKGYAPEAAWASICFGFATLGLSEIVANAAVDNDNSRRVMEKLGMRHDAADDFDHPRVPCGHALRRQVLYRLPRDTWQSADTLSSITSNQKTS